MEALDRAHRRKQGVKKFVSPTIRSVSDIKAALKQLDPKDKMNRNVTSVQLNALVAGHTEDGDGIKCQVSVSSGSKTYREIIIEGLQVVMRRQDIAEEAERKAKALPLVVNERQMIPPTLIASDTAMMSVDLVIERLLGAYRDGRYICWDLEDGYTYKYEIFEHRLTRVKRSD